MDRNEILANFQACTGIEDISQCIAHLEQTDWNLNEAVSVAIAASASTPPPQDHITDLSTTPSLFPVFEASSEPSTSNVRMLHFEVRMNKMTKHISLDETATLSTLRELSAMELGIPKTAAKFNGWPNPGTDNMTDDTSLASLHLPLNVTLTVQTAEMHNGAASSNKYSVFGLKENVSLGSDVDFVPCSALKESDELEKLSETYILEVTDKRTQKVYNLTFNGSKTFEELKFDAHSLTDIPPSKQVWEGLTSDLSLLTLDRTLGSLELNIPVHKCSVTRCADTKPLTSPVDLTVDDDMEVDEYEDASENLSDEFIFSLDSPSSYSLHPLMPEEATDEVSALVQFQAEFRSRYGKEGQATPGFFLDSLDAAVQNAFGGSARNRRLLAVYLHHDKSIQSNVFCSQLLCASPVVDYVTRHCVVWAWDVTSDFNRQRLLDMCSRLLGSGVADTVKRVRRDEFPMLVLAQGRGRSCEVNSIIQGNTSLDELMAQLIKAVEDAEIQKREDIRMEEISEAREKIKREQEKAYEESLKQDMEKQKKLDAEQAKLLQQQEEEKRIAQEKNEKIEKLGQIVPPEPDPSCGQPVTMIRFRPPCGGDMVMRRFLALEKLQGLLNFVGSLGYLSDKYRVISSYPKRDVSSLDPEKSLKDHKLFPQETLIIEEKID